MKAIRGIFCMIFVFAMMVCNFVCLASAYEGMKKPITPEAPMEVKQSVQPKIVPGTAIPTSSAPNIVEFSANPATVTKGEVFVLRWRVNPSSGGSNIKRINIVKSAGPGPALNVSSSDASGEYRVNIPADSLEGTATYTLTAINEADRVSTRLVNVEITGHPDLLIEDIYSSGLSIGFRVKNVGSGVFRGRMNLRISANDMPVAIYDSFREFTRLADGTYEASDAVISPGNTKSYSLLNPETGESGWYSGTYNMVVRVATGNPHEPTANNEKRKTLSHTGLRRGTPQLDLYILGAIRMFESDGWYRDIRFTVFNTGPESAENVDWEVWLLDRGQLSRGEMGSRIGRGTISSLAPGSEEVTFNYNFRGLTEGGLIRVKIDPSDRIFETNETNNVRSDAFVLYRP